MGLDRSEEDLKVVKALTELQEVWDEDKDADLHGRIRMNASVGIRSTQVHALVRLLVRKGVL